MTALPRVTPHGASLVEVLVAFVVVALSMVGAQRLQSGLRLHADVARERSEAVRWAQQTMEQLRAGNEATAPLPETLSLRSRIQTHDDLGLQTRTVQAVWADRVGTPHEVKLVSTDGRNSGVYSAALMLPRAVGPLDRPFGQHPGVPPWHQPLGNGRSVHKPREQGTVALVFDIASGEVVQRCPVAAERRTQDLRIEDLNDCVRVQGSLLSGHLRFAADGDVDTRTSFDGEPLPLTLDIVFSSPSSGPAVCDTQPMKTVRVTRGERTRTEAVPLASSARDLQAEAMQDLGERFTAFTCVIVDARWSGQLVFTPQGWTIGETARDHRLCRLGEPHAPYRNASGALRQQNFLVTRGDRPCPGGTTHNVAPAPQL